MRQLRELPDERTAQLVCDALRESGVECELMDNQRGTFVVWVVDEEKLTSAQALTAAWLDQDGQAALEQLAKRGRASRELSQRIEERRQRQQQAIAEHLAQQRRPRPALLTWGLMALCVAVAVITKLAAEREMVASLLIVDLKHPVAVASVELFGHVFYWLGLPWSQPWRLVTPILVHFDVMHILFNMIMLRVLGSMVEAHHGARYLAAFVLVSAAFSNIAQLEIARSALFGGMSGVVYALLGLIWLRGRLDPRSPYPAAPGTVQFMLIWLVLGFVMQGSGIATANWCHLGGLVVGAAWGYVSAKLAR